MIASKEAFNAALAECDEDQKKIVEELMSGEIDFLERKVYSYSYFSDSSGYGPLEDYDFGENEPNELNEDNEDFDEKTENRRSELYDFAFGGFETLVGKKAIELGETTFTNSEDW
jgi:hypothetical protein